VKQIPKDSIRLLRDVDAYMVPSGDEVKLLAGNLVKITQALGGNYTLIMNGNMVQIREENVDALGIELPENHGEVTNSGDITQQIWDQLKTCYDPEIPVNIVELGLIYDLNVLGPEDSKKVKIQMTLTAPGCGMGPVIAEEVDRKINGIHGVAEVSVDLVWEPMWNRDMMSEEAKLELGML
jgi:probable FeS assembly SUF system protein SufT